MPYNKPIYFDLIATYFLSLCSVLISASTANADINNPIFSQPHNNSYDFTSLSQKWLPYNVNSEAADDFDVVGQVERIAVEGWVFGAVTQYQGVTVKIFAVSAENKPGALQYEQFYPAGNPGVTRSDGYFSIILTTPFQATGRHFLHVQAQMDSPWYWKTANTGAPQQARFCSRNLASGQTLWSNNFNSDLGMTLYGTTQIPPQITSLSVTSINRSGYFEVNGENMGATGQVLINGAPAPFTQWDIYNIHAYVPETAPLGNVLVQVQTSNGTSNSISLEVTPRQSTIPHIKWRFRMDSLYSNVRPAIGPDGSVYVVDVYGYLYALSADGGLKWIVRNAGEKGVDVGADGVVYTGSENHVKAFDPDGSLRWTFIQTPVHLLCSDFRLGPTATFMELHRVEWAFSR